MKTSPLLRAQAAVTACAWAIRTRLEEVQQEAKDRGDRGDSPISTVVIIVAAVAGALIIAGGLAAAYGRANGKLSGILGG
ncbi:hypothetical protein ACIO8G_35260 [Streptomyces sp. NPDC087219]|uniref:hypothetical protein n=1 Tax=unclassified Streptomyces TaxID=2593676 RepID=UPI002253BA32|nr:hypothetical protein [Streptomyces sp. NBC_00233]MCX5231491.1 hypothetical protein [Streptomyces sp. NBC_00233]MCX5233165.1 hypothetical protein [Streptomyces sp. NBC_00233]MCX5233606.1 hypothetical protein [Streptomyces sp. NBC_00233]